MIDNITTYFDILAQCVFQSQFYSFPLSKSKLNDDLKKQLLDEFTGIEIANSQKYLKKLNFYSRVKFSKQQLYEQSLHLNVLRQITVRVINRRVIKPIKFSLIVQIYLTENRYSTRTSMQKYKMKFTESEKNQDELELKFAQNIKLADKIKSEAIAI